MTQAGTVSGKTLEQILARLDALAKDMQTIKTKLFEEDPPYGSEEWWEWSEKKGREEIKAGKGTVIHNKKELKSFLDSLKHS